MEADQSLGHLLTMWGLWTVPNQGDEGTLEAARCRSAGEEKGLSRSGVNGAVRGPRRPPMEEPRKTEPGVRMRALGRGVFKSSVPDVTAYLFIERIAMHSKFIVLSFSRGSHTSVIMSVLACTGAF